MQKAGLDKVQLDYVIRVLPSVLQVDSAQWNALLAAQNDVTPFMRHEYLAALHQSDAARPQTGWTPRLITLWLGDALVGACALYLKAHSYGEYVFDWAWANAYQQHGLNYYPKAVVAVPFTPVPGARLLAKSPTDRAALLQGLMAWCEQEKLSSLHLLFANADDVTAAEKCGLMLRHTVQFHWKNVAPTLLASRSALPPEGADFSRGGPSENLAPTLLASRSALPPEGANFSRGGPSKNCQFHSFDEFLASLSQEKRKKIRQERRKVAEAGVTFRSAQGRAIADPDWDFFYRCYERTYLEHGNAPYLSRDFFRRMKDTMPENWLLFVAEQNGEAIACSLIGITASPAESAARAANKGTEAATTERIAYGRYWGALKRVDCLHFEACYYQPLQWCIKHGYARFEGGAQGEHKMARALMPVKTTSAHWLAHPSFADAIERFLEREGQGIDSYLGELTDRSPFKPKL